MFKQELPLHTMRYITFVLSRVCNITKLKPVADNDASQASDKEVTRAINLIGKELSCQESRYRIEADIARLLIKKRGYIFSIRSQTGISLFPTI